MTEKLDNFRSTVLLLHKQDPNSWYVHSLVSIAVGLAGFNKFFFVFWIVAVVFLDIPKYPNIFCDRH